MENKKIKTINQFSFSLEVVTLLDNLWPCDTKERNEIEQRFLNGFSINKMSNVVINFNLKNIK